MSKQNLNFGKSAEEDAVGLLRKNGYQIIARNYKNKLGEIDIIALDKDTVCFVEVKARRSERFGLPQEAITVSKQRQIFKVAVSFLKENNLFDKKARFDVVSVMFFKEDGPKLDLIRNAF